MNHDNDDNPSSTASDETVIRHRWDGTTSPSMAVVEAVAIATDREPTELSQLHRTINADALDSLITGETDFPLEITFVYDGVTVVVDQSGAIEVVVPGS
jgi:hypothetical protein